MAREKKARKAQKSLKKSKKMEAVKPLVTTGTHYKSVGIVVRSPGA